MHAMNNAFSFGRLCALASAAAFLVAPSAAFSAAISYGDFSDIPPGAVIYTDVEESSGTDPIPLFGDPSIIVNDLDFEPVSFVATSTGGPLDATDAELSFGIETLPGAGIDELIFVEGGDFFFDGFGGAGTTAKASLFVSIKIMEVDHVDVPDMVLTFSDSFVSDMALTGGATDPSLGWSIVLPAALGPAIGTYEYGVTKAEVYLNNRLSTNSEDDSLAFIAKKDFTVIPGGDLTPDDIIPEPTAASLVLLSLAGIGACRRRA